MDNFFFYFAITGRDWNLYILCGDREENEFVFLRLCHNLQHVSKMNKYLPL